MPDGGVEAVGALVAFAVVELGGVGVGFVDGSEISAAPRPESWRRPARAASERGRGGDRQDERRPG